MGRRYRRGSQSTKVTPYRLLDALADKALVGDAALGGACLDGRHKRFRQAHVDEGDLGLGLPSQGLEGGEAEVEEILAGLIMRVIVGLNAGLWWAISRLCEGAV